MLPKTLSRSLTTLCLPAFALSLLACGESTDVGPDNDVVAQPSDIDIPEVDYERTAEAPTPGMIEASGCNADLARPYIGRDLDVETRSALLGDVAPLVDVRWLGPAEQMTGDVDPQRLNVTFDDNDVITAVACG